MSSEPMTRFSVTQDTINQEQTEQDRARLQQEYIEEYGEIPSADKSNYHVKMGGARAANDSLMSTKMQMQ